MKNGIVKSKAVTPTTVADKTIMIFQRKRSIVGIPTSNSRS